MGRGREIWSDGLGVGGVGQGGAGQGDAGQGMRVRGDLTCS